MLGHRAQGRGATVSELCDSVRVGHSLHSTESLDVSVACHHALNEALRPTFEIIMAQKLTP